MFKTKEVEPQSIMYLPEVYEIAHPFYTEREDASYGELIEMAEFIREHAYREIRRSVERGCSLEHALYTVASDADDGDLSIALNPDEFYDLHEKAIEYEGKVDELKEEICGMDEDDEEMNGKQYELEEAKEVLDNFMNGLDSDFEQYQLAA